MCSCWVRRKTLYQWHYMESSRLRFHRHSNDIVNPIHNLMTWRHCSIFMTMVHWKKDHTKGVKFDVRFGVNSSLNQFSSELTPNFTPDLIPNLTSLLVFLLESDGLYIYIYIASQLKMPISCQRRSSLFLNVLIDGAFMTSCVAPSSFYHWQSANWSSVWLLYDILV